MVNVVRELGAWLLDFIEDVWEHEPEALIFIALPLALVVLGVCYMLWTGTMHWKAFLVGALFALPVVLATGRK